MGCAALVLILLLLSGGATSSQADVRNDGAPVEHDIQEQDTADEAAPTARPTWSIRSTRIPYDYMWSFRSRRPSGMTTLRTTRQRQKSTRARVTTMLLICSILAVYGASRWLQAGEIAVEAQTAAAARREELQESLAEYEEKVKISADLAKQLADRKAQAAQLQFELQAAAREAEKAEKDLINELSKQATGGIDYSAILDALISEATAAEHEAEVLRLKLESLGYVEAFKPFDEDGDSKVQKAYEEQRQLATKKKELIEKLAHRASLEANWGDAIKAEGGDILEAIEQATKEIEELKQKKLQLKRETIEQAKHSILLEQKQDAKEELEIEVHLLKTQVDAKIASNAAEEELLKQQQELQDEKLKELEDLKAKIAEAKEERAKLAADFERLREELVKALSPVSDKVSAKAKDPECVSGICKGTANKLMQKRDQIHCEDLVCEAVKEHEKLEDLQKAFASVQADAQCEKTRQDISLLESQLTDESLPDTERTLIQQRIEYLKEQVETAAEKLMREAIGSESELFLLLEFRHLAQYRASRAIANVFDDMLEDNPSDSSLEAKYLVAQSEFEAKRLEMMNTLDTAAAIVREKNVSQEICRLFKEEKEPEQALEIETQVLKDQIKETERKLEISQKRYLRARKVLVSRRNEGQTPAVLSPIRTISWKARLISEDTMRKFYVQKLARLEKRLATLDIVYMDQLERAREVWREAQEDIANDLSRWYAVGVSRAALETPGAAEEKLEAVEDFIEEEEYEPDEERAVAGLKDDPNLTDAELILAPSIQPKTFAELIQEEGHGPVTDAAETESSADESDGDADIDV